jgi:hypothetical protein
MEEDILRAQQAFEQALNEISQTGMVSAKSLEAVASSANQLSASQLSLKNILVSVGSALLGVAKAAVESAANVRANRESFAGLDAVMGESIGIFAKLIGVEDEVRAGLRYMTAELDRTTSAYQSLGMVGALSSEGVEGFRASVDKSLLGMEGFTRVVAATSQSLAFARGNAANGAKALADFTARLAEDGTDQKLLKLGIGFEKQAEFNAEYLAVQRRMGLTEAQIQGTTNQQVEDYAKRLNSLSRLTGLQTEAVQAQLDQLRRDSRIRAAVAVATSKYGEKAGAAIENVALGLQQMAGGGRIAEGFGDLLFNAGTEAAKGLQVITGGQAQKIAENLANGRITEAQAQSQLIEAIRTHVDQIGGPEQLGRLSKLGTLYDQFGVELFEITQRAGTTVGELDKTNKEAGKLSKAAGQTEELTKMQLALRNLGAEVDQIVTDLVFPNAIGSVKFFTEQMYELTTTLRQQVQAALNYMGKSPTPPPSPPSEGEPPDPYAKATPLTPGGPPIQVAVNNPTSNPVPIQIPLIPAGNQPSPQTVSYNGSVDPMFQKVSNQIRTIADQFNTIRPNMGGPANTAYAQRADINPQQLLERAVATLSSTQNEAATQAMNSQAPLLPALESMQKTMQTIADNTRRGADASMQNVRYQMS